LDEIPPSDFAFLLALHDHTHAICLSLVQKIVMDNADVLQKAFPDEFGKPGLVEESLFRMQKRMSLSNSSSNNNNNNNNNNSANANKYPLSLQHFDDKHQQHEMVFAVAKDDINKRITVAFRGTDNELSMSTNWSTNLSVVKTYVAFPPSVQANMGDKNGMYVHSGFYNYLFEKTFEDSDDPDKRKYDEVLEHVVALTAEYPTYKIYVTGHSLGGAMSSLIAFFLASHADLPKPISCINFASPRVGDGTFLEACQTLEEEGALRICRIVNDKDSIPFLPMFYYSHVGFQVRLYDDGATYEPEVTYPKVCNLYAISERGVSPWYPNDPKRSVVPLTIT
jgi:hypothetical protein